MYLYMRERFLFSGGEWVNLWKFPTFTLPCHIKIVLALHPASCYPLHNEGTSSLEFRGAEIGDRGWRESWRGKGWRDRWLRAQWWRMSFLGSFEERCGSSCGEWGKWMREERNFFEFHSPQGARVWSEAAHRYLRNAGNNSLLWSYRLIVGWHVLGWDTALSLWLH